MRLIIALLIWFQSLIALAASPAMHFNRLPVDHALPQNSIYSILQDQRGFLWFATEDGLNRYDGYEFLTFRHDPKQPGSLSHNYINKIYQNLQGTLWVGTSNGLNRFDHKSRQFARFNHQPDNPNSLSNDNVTTILEDSTGVLWVGTDNGLNKFDPISQSFTRFEHQPEDPRSLSHNAVRTIYEDAAGTLWIGTNGGGLNRFEPASKDFVHYRHQPNNNNSLSHDRIFTIIEDNQGVLWIGTLGGGLNQLDQQRQQFTRYKNKYLRTDSLSHNIVLSLHQDSTGRLWVGTLDGGLNLFDAKHQRFIRFNHNSADADSLSSDRVWSLFEDANKALWIGTSAGLNKFNILAQRFGHFKHLQSDPSSLSHDIVTAFQEDAQGTLWIGTAGGLNQYVPQTQYFRQFRHDSSNPNSLSHDNISAIFKDRSGQLWIGTDGGGLNRFDPQTGQFVHYRHDSSDPLSLSDDQITSINEDNNGQLWIGTSDSGLDKFNPKNQRFVHFRHRQSNPRSLSNDAVNTIYFDSSNTLWVGTTDGLNRYNPQQEDFKRFKHQPSNPNNSLSQSHILSIFQDSRERLWIGTFGEGLNLYNSITDSFRHFREKDGLANDVINDILEDDTAQLWLSTNHGLSRFNPQDQNFNNYDISDGLQSNEFNRGASYRSISGELFFGGINGFNRFQGKDILGDSQPPKVVLTRFSLFNQPIPISGSINAHQSAYQLPQDIELMQELNLSYQQNLLTFEFAALHFSNPIKNNYAYKLKGLDREWIYTDATRRLATYTSLPPGSYTLQIKASNNDGYWNEQFKSLKINILPPPWFTWWAYSLYALLMLSLMFAFADAQRKKLRDQRQKTLDQHALNQQLKQVDRLKDEFLANTSHELRTPLNGIIGLAESLMDGVGGPQSNASNANLAMIVSSGRRLANLVNDILDFSKLKNHNISLNVRAVDLHSMVDVVLTLSHPLVGDKTLKLVNSVPFDLSAALADEDRLQQIFHNLIGNAIKFTDEGEVTVSATETEDGLNISVMDTGIGITQAQYVTIFNSFEQGGSSDRTYSGTGLGLSVSKQLVNLHGGDITVESTLGEGSTFSFTLPTCDEQPEANTTLHVAAHTATYTSSNSPANIALNPMVSRLHQFEDDSDDLTYTKMAPDSNKFRILLVDDEPINRQVLHNYLSLQNYQLVEASDGEHALDAVKNNGPFDLVLLDIMMPGMTGYEVCQKLREDHPASDLPVIFLTAKNQVADLVQSFAVGGNDYLSKPVAKYELLTRVENHLKFLDINRNLEYKVAERTKALVQSNQRVTALSEVCSQISSTLDLDQLLSTLYSHIEALMVVDILCLGLYEVDKRRIVFELAIESDEYLPPYIINMSETYRPAVWCISKKRPLIMNDFDKDYAKYFGDAPIPKPMEGDSPGALMYYPLIVAEQIIGVLTVQSFQKNAYNEYQQDMLRTIASTTAIALDNANAYRQIARQNREIISTQQQLVQSEKMASLGTLTAGVAHEINNPTNFVHVSAQNLEVDLSRFKDFLFELAGEDAEQAIFNSLNAKFLPLHEHLNTIKNGTERIKIIVQDLRAFSQLDSADQKTVQVAELLNSTVSLVKTKYLEMTEFTTDLADSGELHCYPAQLNQVFMNLIVNACDAIRDRQRQDEQQDKEKGRGLIAIGCRLIDGFITVTIRDNGCGMTNRTKTKLFEPFYTTKDVGEGTGLGLSISYGIVQKHNGELHVDSELGVGTTFTLKLPAST
ncbi:MAG: signal transduction histidine kinase/ligand-binding sensor domain-containing protein [Phenylobacterium sp.]|jgi:signal transduction histidine kinase/ligand-binding sensor domain-containing protein/DNA-binding response OmpR family regulator